MKRPILHYVTAALLTAAWSTSAFAAIDNSTSNQAVVTDGPIKLTVRVDRNVARVADPIQLTLEARAQRGMRV
jgi:hypothetical protein